MFFAQLQSIDKKSHFGMDFFPQKASNFFFLHGSLLFVISQVG